MMMEWEALTLLQHAGPLTAAVLILVAGMRLGKLWNKVEELLKLSDEREDKLVEIEQRLAVLESRVGDS